MEQKKNPYVYIYEPVLEGRKTISALFPLSSFIHKFYDNLDMLRKDFLVTPAHIVLYNLDATTGETLKFIESNSALFPPEVALLGMSKNPKNPKFSGLKLLNIKEIFEYPLSGMKVKPHINSISRNLGEFAYNLVEPLSVTAFFNSVIKGVGETDLLVDSNIKIKEGSKLVLVSELLPHIIKGSVSFIVSKNKHSFVVNNAMIVTMLGLNNEELQNIRSNVLHWEKL